MARSIAEGCPLLTPAGRNWPSLLSRRGRVLNSRLPMSGLICWDCPKSAFTISSLILGATHSLARNLPLACANSSRLNCRYARSSSTQPSLKSQLRSSSHETTRTSYPRRRLRPYLVKRDDGRDRRQGLVNERSGLN